MKHFILSLLILLSISGCSDEEDNTQSKNELKKANQLLRTGGLKEAVSIIESLADKNYPPALLKLSEMYERGNGVTSIEGKSGFLRLKAIRFYRLLAESGDAQSQYELSQLGIGSEESLMWLEKAAAQEHTLAVAALVKRVPDKWLQKAVAIYEKNAQKGDYEAQYLLAELYEKGKGVNKDLNKAISLYEQAAEQGQMKAAKHLARMHDYPKSSYWVGRVFNTVYQDAEYGDTEAQLDLGFFYKNGSGHYIAQKGLAGLMQKAREGDVNAELELGTIGYFNDNGLFYAKNDTNEIAKRMFDLNKKAAQQGNVDAIMQMKSYYEHGDYANNIAPDYKMYVRAFVDAYTIYRERAEKGDKDAIEKLIGFYREADRDKIERLSKLDETKKAAEEGKLEAQIALISLLENQEERAMWQKKIEDRAQNGDVQAQLELGKLLRSKAWYEMAALNGNAEAQYSLSFFYKRDKNYNEAIKWCKNADANGYTDAAAQIGYIYKLYLKNNSEASKWFKEAVKKTTAAAKKGDVESQRTLGYWYLHGQEVVTIDLDKALYWLNEGSKNGDVKSSIGLFEIYKGKFGADKYKDDAKAEEVRSRLTSHDSDVRAEAIKKMFAFVSKEAQGIQSINYWLEKAKQQTQTFEQTELLQYQQKADTGDVSALLTLAKYYKGKDNKKSFDLYLKAAEAGAVTAQLHVAETYLRGDSFINIQKDVTKADSWFHKAAEQANKEVFDKMKKYYSDRTSPLISIKALYWFKKAAASPVNSDERNQAQDLVKELS